jgi:hypothetical protein
MTPEERQLVTALGDRLRASPQQVRDPEADAFIQGLLRERPDAPYLLAQTVIMQDLAMRSASAQIADLQRQLEAARQAAPQQSSGSFLGGLFGGARPAPVPSPGPWGQAAPPPQPGPWGQPAYQPVYGAPMMQPSQTSGFLRSAAQTAVGVAGGALLFEGIQSLFSGHHGYPGWDPSFGGGGLMPQGSISETTIINNYNDAPGQGAGAYGGNADYDPAADLSSRSDFTPDVPVDTGSDDYAGDGGGGDDWI